MRITKEQLLDIYYPNRPKCKCCGKDIIYDNTQIFLNKKKRISIKGKSFLTEKIVDGTTYTLQVCQDCLLKNYPDIKNLNRTFNVMSNQTMFAFNIPIEIFEASREKYAMTLDHMIEKYGIEEGRKKWNDYCKKQAETNTFEYKQKVYGWTKEQFDEYNSSRAVTLKNLIKRHGEEEGRKKWDEYCKRQSETKSWDWMVENYGIDRAREINSQKAITLENFIRKYGEEEGRKKWDEYIPVNLFGFSKKSQILFENLDKYIGQKYTTYYHNKNKEYEVPNYKGSSYFLDYYIEELNICIEFNGSCFHGDERIYKDDDKCNPFDKELTAKELRDKDFERYKYLKENYGIITFVIWESDYDEKTFDYIQYINNVLKIDI